MVDYPVKFSSDTKSDSGANHWHASSGNFETEVSYPEEFGGEEEHPSPESLFLMAVENCLVATFTKIAERQELVFEHIDSGAEAYLDRNEEGRPVIKEAEVSITVEGVEDREKAEQVKEAALRNCFIHRSVKTEITSDFEFR